MHADTTATIAAAEAHLRRDAFFTRDNPFASIHAGTVLAEESRELLGSLLEGSRNAAEWLETEEAQGLLSSIDAVCLPRDVQLTGDRSVTVTSVHAFIDAPAFWWMVSVLWCIETGRAIDRALDDGVRGYRLHDGFLDDPTTSGFMFKNPTTSYKSWKRHIADESAKRAGHVLAANTVDIASFYYSITSPPTKIIADFPAAGQSGAGAGAANDALSLLIDAMHAAYADRLAALRPRSVAGDVSTLTPLPVGLPSSRVLANAIAHLAIRDLCRNPNVAAVAAYADDFVVLSPVLPEPLEPIADYFRRLVLLNPDTGQLEAPTACRHAVLTVSIEKSGCSYSRSVGRSDDSQIAEELDYEEDGESTTAEEASHDDDSAREFGELEPYFETESNPEWGGPLRTVLRAPQRREREPKKLQRSLASLVGEIAVGLDSTAISTRLTKIMDELDSSVFLRVRSYWPDLLMAGIAASGSRGVTTLTRDFLGAIQSLDVAPDAPPDQRRALMRGLHASWRLAVSLAMAVTTSEAQRAWWVFELPEVIGDEQPVPPLLMTDAVALADQMRAQGLIPPQFVSVPLAELTRWTGPLLGRGVVADFTEWALHEGDSILEQLRERARTAIRFLQLHEACLAIHMWAAPGSETWLDDTFGLLREQPLVRQSDLDELRDLALIAITPAASALPTETEEIKQLRLRLAMPSVRVRADQLQALLADDQATLAGIRTDARRQTQIVVNSAVKRKADVLVLPEWCVPAELFGWLMNRCRVADILVVAGQAPTMVGGAYSNKLWTGLPLRDSAWRRSCLVPPPREKSLLSPHERQPLEQADIAHTPSGGVPTYRWRGFGVASLICYEFADAQTRLSLRDTTDLLTVSSLNRDWRSFDAIQDVTTRDNYCVTLCVNTSDFPGTKVMRPTSSEKAVVASVHGSDYPAVVFRLVDLLPIVAARATRKRPSDALATQPVDDVSLDDYKPVPPSW